MGYKLYSKITCPNPTEGPTENIGEGSVKFHPGQLKPHLNTILIMFFIVCPIFYYPIRPHATIIECTKPYANPSSSNLLSSYI